MLCCSVSVFRPSTEKRPRSRAASGGRLQEEPRPALGGSRLVRATGNEWAEKDLKTSATGRGVAIHRLTVAVIERREGCPHCQFEKTSEWEHASPLSNTEPFRIVQHERKVSFDSSTARNKAPDNRDHTTDYTNNA